MRVLLLGSGGMLARALRQRAPTETVLVTREHAELDIRDDAAVARAIRDSRAAAVINASAYTNVEMAERDRDTAFAVNATAVGELARLCRESRCRVVHFSTDFVIDGSKSGFYTETDDARPLSIYGASKLAGERACLRELPSALVLRTQWLFGVGGRSFVGSMWERAQAHQHTRVVTDQAGCCTYTCDLADATWRLVWNEQAHGVIHYVNRGRISRFELAEYVFSLAGAADLLSPSRSADFLGAAPRPANSALSVAVAEKLLGAQIPPWQDAIQRFLKELREAPGGDRLSHTSLSNG